MTRTADEFRQAAEEHGLVSWPINRCTFCGYQCAFVITEGHVYYDAGCWCVRVPDKLRPTSWGEVADHYNRQDNADVIAQMDEHWHFTSVTT